MHHFKKFIILKNLSIKSLIHYNYIFIIYIILIFLISKLRFKFLSQTNQKKLSNHVTFLLKILRIVV